MTREMHLLGEAIQEITLIAWPIIYNDNKYDQASQEVLETIRDWAEEFETWWQSHDEDWICEHDFVEEIERYTDLKCKEYLHDICDRIEDDTFNQWSNMQEFTAEAVCKEHFDSFFGYLMEERNMSREEAFKLIREWADEFWFSYIARPAFEIYKSGMSYYDLVDQFINDKLALYKAN